MYTIELAKAKAARAIAEAQCAKAIEERDEYKADNDNWDRLYLEQSEETERLLQEVKDLDTLRRAHIDLIEVNGKFRAALREIEKHGCCVMHNDSGCPGCLAKDALK